MTTLRGKCSWFGGPEDMGVSSSEGLAFIYDYETAPDLFLDYQPSGTTGLARRLNPDVYYIACRWDYDATSKTDLLDIRCLVRNPKTGKAFVARPADWGPHEEKTGGRVADLSKSLLDDLELDTDDEVEVVFPYYEEDYEEVPIDEGEKIMPYDSICISSGHGLYVRGAAGILDEVDEARNVTEQLANELISRGVEVKTFHDDISKSQSENLNRITDWHNSQKRDLDISIHFNAYEQVDKCMGTEVLYVTQGALASDLSEAIARCGFVNRGAKKRTDLHFLNQTDMPSVLLEVCFVDSDCDAVLYEAHFENICYELANVLGGELEYVEPPEAEKPPPGPSIVQPGPIGDPSRPTVQPVPRIDIEIHGEVILTINGDLVKV